MIKINLLGQMPASVARREWLPREQRSALLGLGLLMLTALGVGGWWYYLHHTRVALDAKIGASESELVAVEGRRETRRGYDGAQDGAGRAAFAHRRAAVYQACACPAARDGEPERARRALAARHQTGRHERADRRPGHVTDRRHGFCRAPAEFRPVPAPRRDSHDDDRNHRGRHAGAFFAQGGRGARAEERHRAGRLVGGCSFAARGAGRAAARPPPATSTNPAQPGTSATPAVPTTAAGSVAVAPAANPVPGKAGA